MGVPHQVRHRRLSLPTTGRVRRAPLIVAAAVVAAACSRGGDPGRTRASSVHDSGSSRQPLVLSIRPAPYRLAAPVQREVAVLDGGTVYLAGGLDAAGTSAAGAFTLDPASGKLTPIGSFQNAFHDAAGAVIGGNLFVFGGGSSTGSNLVQAFNLSTGTASVVGRLPVALADLSTATVDGTVYLVGGYDNKTPRREIYATADGRSFRVVARLPVGLRYPAVVAVGPTLVIAGGQGVNGMVDTVYALDTTTGSISTLAQLPVPVGHSSAFAIGGVVYVAGGESSAGAAVASVTMIDPADGSVRRLSPLARPVSDAGTVSLRHGALIVGGLRGSPVDQVLRATLEQPRSSAGSP